MTTQGKAPHIDTLTRKHLADGGTRGTQYWLRTLLRWPILYKILIANAAMILVWSLGGVWLAETYAQRVNSVESYVSLVATGILLSLLTNFFVVRTALHPLSSLEAVVQEVQRGNLHARAELGAVSDPSFDRLANTMNAMLDRLDSYTAAIEAEKTRSQLLAAEVIKAQEAERQRVARELHDETSQALATLIISLEMIEAQVGPEQKSLASGLAEIKSLTSRMLESIRQLAYDLRPTMLDDLGLVPAVRWCMKNHLEKIGIKVQLDSVGLGQRLDPELETAVYRIVQESITNIAKHAKARHVKILLRADDSAVTAVIEDDGVGFDVDRVLNASARERGLGLFGMQERALVLEGKLDCHSIPGVGTRISAVFPLQVGQARS